MNKKELLFELVRTSVLSECGDGDAVIVSNKHKQLAEDFIEYENKLDKPYFIRKDISATNDAICIYPVEDPSQEAVVFTSFISEYDIDKYNMTIFLADYF